MITELLFIFCGGAICVVGLNKLFIEYKANKKKHKIKLYSSMVKKEIVEKKDAIVMGIGATALNIIDIYSAIENHSEILEVLEQRFPNEVGEASNYEWFEKISNLFNDNDRSIEAYVSAFKGQAAENIALELLRDNGINAELADSLINKDTDIVVNSIFGSDEYSVKCGSVDYIENCIENSDAKKYIVNSESYESMSQNGMLEEFDDRGVEIIDGEFHDVQLEETASNAFNDIEIQMTLLRIYRQ